MPVKRDFRVAGIDQNKSELWSSIPKRHKLCSLELADKDDSDVKGIVLTLRKYWSMLNVWTLKATCLVSFLSCKSSHYPSGICCDTGGILPAGGRPFQHVLRQVHNEMVHPVSGAKTWTLIPLSNFGINCYSHPGLIWAQSWLLCGCCRGPHGLEMGVGTGCFSSGLHSTLWPCMEPITHWPHMDVLVSIITQTITNKEKTWTKKTKEEKLDFIQEKGCTLNNLMIRLYGFDV